MQEKFVLKTWQISIVILFGTIVRFIYGIYTKQWLDAPDQIAWELTLSEAIESGSISYNSLIHYPHEGGTLIISLISICLRPLQVIMPSLSLAALLIDSAGRLIQIKLAHRIFGPVAAGWFAIWTILSVPLLIPWASVNFGLHSLASFLPFVFLYFATTYQSKYPRAIICGIVTGLSISFSYNSIVFIPAFLIIILINRESVRKKSLDAFQFFSFVLIALLPHIAARMFFDNGFAWLGYQIYPIRAVPVESIYADMQLRNIIYVWHQALPASFLVSSINFISSNLQRDIIFCFLITGFMLVFIKPDRDRKNIYFAFVLIFLYMLFYALSPFYSDDIKSKLYIYYRHLAYILPLIVLIMIRGFINARKLGIYLLILFMLVCGTGTIMNFATTKPPQRSVYRAAGWIVVMKYGDDTGKLIRIYDDSPDEQKNEVMTGYGWGLACAILNRSHETDTMRVNQLIDRINQFPDQHQIYLEEGIQYAFAKNVTPGIDKKLLLIFEDQYEK